MTAYWGSSAIIAAWINPEIRMRLHRERGVTRTHSLVEVFSAFTGGDLTIRQGADEAARTIANLAQDLDQTEVVAALRLAHVKGLRGGRVHDYLHAVAAEKIQAEKLLTVDRGDFNGITVLEIEQLG
ncbi:MAG: hypothetical protein M9920_05980 [Verrucomicrobiae bacterium]|nr:hypothetical protein [Verrucomicrobiae bacterium]